MSKIQRVHTKVPKRHKRICSHPNPLFEKWLSDWQKEAETRGSNMKYNFQRAIKSLRKYPLPLHSGKDCIILAHFGDKICKMIDHKIEEYVKEHGPINWEDHIKIYNVRPKGRKLIKKKAPSVSMNVVGKQITEKRASHHQKCEKRQYIPAYRSGAYALMISLYKALNSSNSADFLKKQELIKTAQEFCDASFTVSEGSHYTAWNSMSTLIKKRLVERAGNPSRYSLTEEGKHLGSLLKATPFSNPSSPIASDGGVEISDKSASLSCEAKSSKTYVVHDISSSDEEVEPEKEGEVQEISLIDKSEDEPMSEENDVASYPEGVNSNTDSSPPHSDTHKDGCFFMYVMVDGEETTVKERAQVSVDEDKGTLLFLIKAKIIDLFRSTLEYELEETRDPPAGYTYALLADSCAPEFISGVTQSRQEPGGHLDREAGNSSQEPQSPEPIFAPQRQASSRPRKPDVQTTFPPKNSVKEDRRPPSSQPDEILPVLEPDTLLFASPSSLKPGSYQIVLCMDNTEALGGPNGGIKNAKGILKGELERHRIKFQVKKLSVGDFLWTCQGCDSNGQTIELVLPYVIERKRMDDLSCSIQDGRFKEQKFRLKQSGLPHPIYLVEEFGSSLASLPVSTCQQALTNTQIIDKFMVKITKDVKETAAYLTLMTRYLQGKFKDKTLHCVPRDSPFLSKGAWSSPLLYLMSLHEFNSFSAKTRPLSVQDMFMKQLLQMSGASVDKVSSIVQKYPTPRTLIEALESSPPPVREKLLCEIKCQKSGRAVDKTVSAQIARLYTWRQLS